MILVAAIAIGAIAAFALQNYVKGVEDRAKPNPVEALVMTQTVDRGTDGSAAKAVIAKKTIPAEFLPDTAIRDLKEIEGKVAVANLPANQVLVQGMFVQAEVLNTTFRDRISTGNVAFAMTVDAVRAVGGKLQPGDEINIYTRPEAGGAAASDSSGAPAAPTTTLPPAGAAAAVAGPNPFTTPARVLYEKVRVLAIGDAVAKLAGETSTTKDKTVAAADTSGTIILEVTPEAALRLASIKPAWFYLTLVPKDWKPTVIAPLTNADTQTTPLPGEDAARLTPYGPAGFQTAVQTGAPASTTTTVKKG
jgi:Flp pilus assembly protein CpaB